MGNKICTLNFLHKSQKGVASAEPNFGFMGNMPAPMLRPYTQLSIDLFSQALVMSPVFGHKLDMV